MTKRTVLGALLRISTLATIMLTVSSATPQQDLNFRLLNIERRLDQLQNRIDYVERQYQNQSVQSLGGSDAMRLSILELQRQNLSMAEQLVTMQRQMLEQQKKIDRLSEKMPEPDKKEAQKDEPKPKAKTQKP